MGNILEGITPDRVAVECLDIETFRHILHIHYYLERCGIRLRPEQDLHDKDKLLDKRIKDALALEYCRGREGYVGRDGQIEERILGGVKLHRINSNHHKIWTDSLSNPTHDDYMEGGFDIACTMLENRPFLTRMGLSVCSLEMLARDPERYVQRYQNGDTIDKLPYVREAIGLMGSVERPEIERITSLRMMPNIGVSKSLYERVMMLRDLELRVLEDYSS